MPGRTHSHLRAIAATGLAWLGLLYAVRALCRRADVGLDLLFRDPAAVASMPFYVGALSNLGILLWGVAAGAAAVGWLALREARGGDARELAWCLAAFGALSLLCGVDDLLQLHEEIAPRILGIRESTVYLAYVAAAGAWALRFRAVLLERAPLPLLAAVGAFAASIVVDALGDLALARLPQVYEDGPKLLGILLWALVGAVLALAAVSVRAGAGAIAPDATARAALPGPAGAVPSGADLT